MADQMTASEFIAGHNAWIEAFKSEYLPRIKALTDEECARVYERWAEPGMRMSPDRIALEFRHEFGMTWPESHALGIGIELIRTVLARLDRFDPDYRTQRSPDDGSQQGVSGR
ncbi:hypothetical protein HFN89_05790 [Rhizobium laguerreae]|nr:hypothetical protein [Rhizobium laguerreae]